MITLATLKEAKAQEVFDQVAVHLLTQMRKSVTSAGDCAYRGDHNLKCAAGCLMTDAELAKMGYKNNVNEWDALCELKLVPKKHLSLIKELQTIHDYSTPPHWYAALNDLASARKLNKRTLVTFCKDK
jgi:hypothetical protein